MRQLSLQPLLVSLLVLRCLAFGDPATAAAVTAAGTGRQALDATTSLRRLGAAHSNGSRKWTPQDIKPAKQHAYVAMCSIFKNEHDHVLEWIQYHHWLGVGKFYVFDHGSSPPMAAVLQEWVEAGVVEVLYFTNAWQLDLQKDKAAWIYGGREFLSPQAWAYDNCFKWFGHRHTFISTMDADEYVILRGTSPYRPDLPTFLKAYEAHGGLMVHWQVMGPSGHQRRPAAGTMASYTQCASREDMQAWREFQVNPIGFMKSFTNTQYAAGGCNPHKCVVQGKQYVNEDFLPLGGNTVRQVHWDKIAIFHYVTRSAQEYAKKLARGSGHSQFSSANKQQRIKNRGWSYFRMINTTSRAQCLEGTWMHRLCFEDRQQETYHEARERHAVLAPPAVAFTV